MSDYLERTKQFWNGEIARANLLYPDINVIRFVKKNYPNPKDTTILDYGCGAGRNTIALAMEGYNVIATDYAESAISITKEKCKEIGVSGVRVIKKSGFEIPVDDGKADAVVADGSLFYYSKESIIQIINNISMSMKKDALLWADFRTKKDSLFGKGKEISDGLFELYSDTGREGCTYYFCDEDELRDIFSNTDLAVLSLDDYGYSDNNRSVFNSWFHVVAKKL